MTSSSPRRLAVLALAVVFSSGLSACNSDSATDDNKTVDQKAGEFATAPPDQASPSVTDCPTSTASASPSATPSKGSAGAASKSSAQASPSSSPSSAASAVPTGTSECGSG